MPTIKHFFLWGICLLLSPSLFAQGDYFITRSDSLKIEGLTLVSGIPELYSEACLQVIGNDTVRYGPEDLREYGYAGGRVFVSYPLGQGRQAEWVFFERLNAPGVEVLRRYQPGKDSYYLVWPGEQPVRIDSLDAATVYARLSEPDSTLFARFPTRLTRTRLIRDVKRYYRSLNPAADTTRSGKPKRPFVEHQLTLGAYIGGHGTDWRFATPVEAPTATDLPNAWTVANSEAATYRPSYNISYGLMAEFPLLDFMALRTELQYQAHGFLYAEYDAASGDQRGIASLKAGMRAIRVPALLKFYPRRGKVKPYLLAGGGFVHTWGVENELRVYTDAAASAQGIAAFEQVEGPTLPESWLSYQRFQPEVGGGIRIPIHGSWVIMAECRAFWLAASTQESLSLRVRQVNFGLQRTF